MENNNLLLNKNEELQNEIYRLKDTINEQEKLLHLCTFKTPILRQIIF